MAPQVSIIIPLYNKAEHVQKTIGSVLDQTLQDFEIIVVDDGSTDESGKLVSRMNDRRIKYVRQENQGPGAARSGPPLRRS